MQACLWETLALAPWCFLASCRSEVCALGVLGGAFALVLCVLMFLWLFLFLDVMAFVGSRYMSVWARGR